MCREVEEAVELVAPVECEFSASMIVVEVVVEEAEEVVVVVLRRNGFSCFCFLF